MSVSPVPHSPGDATQAVDLPLPDGLLARDQASLSTILQSPVSFTILPTLYSKATLYLILIL